MADSLETMRKLLKLFASARTQTLAFELWPRYQKLCTYCKELCSSLSSPASLYLSLLQSMMSNNGSDKTKYTFEGTYSKFLHSLITCWLTVSDCCLCFYSSTLQASGQSNQDHTSAASEIIHQFLKLQLHLCNRYCFCFWLCNLSVIL